MLGDWLRNWVKKLSLVLNLCFLNDHTDCEEKAIKECTGYFDLFVQVYCLNHGPTNVSPPRPEGPSLTSWTIHCHQNTMRWYVDGLEVVAVFVSTMCDTVNTSITLLFLVFRVVLLGRLFASCSQIPEDDEFQNASFFFY